MTDDPKHLGQTGGWMRWEWSRENPVEIILVIFVLVLFFMLPRSGCGIEKSQGGMPTSPAISGEPRTGS